MEFPQITPHNLMASYSLRPAIPVPSPRRPIEDDQYMRRVHKPSIFSTADILDDGETKRVRETSGAKRGERESAEVHDVPSLLKVLKSCALKSV